MTIRVIMADLDSLRDYLREPAWEDIFELIASAAANKKWFQVGIDVHILILNIMSSLSHLHGFQLLELLP